MTTTIDSTANWLRPFSADPRAELRLICLPHAGGTPTAFRGWQRRLPARVQVLAACYPGRQDRLAEPCLSGMAAMADALTAALTPYLDRPLAIFGHSMGSAIGYEVALRLQERHGIAPVRLFVSGRGAPHRIAPTDFHRRDDEALIAQVRSLGGTGAEAFEHPELRELLLPSLRADYMLIERYRPEPGRVRRIDAPVTGYLGDADAACTPEEFTAWSQLTTGPFSTHIYSGGHFFLTEHEDELISNISAYLTS